METNSKILPVQFVDVVLTHGDMHYRTRAQSTSSYNHQPQVKLLPVQEFCQSSFCQSGKPKIRL